MNLLPIFTRILNLWLLLLHAKYNSNCKSVLCMILCTSFISNVHNLSHLSLPGTFYSSGVGSSQPPSDLPSPVTSRTWPRSQPSISSSILPKNHRVVTSAIQDRCSYTHYLHTSTTLRRQQRRTGGTVPLNRA